MNLIDKHGYLSIPLYHGTSSIFIESIISDGLGAISQNANYDIELFRKICSAHHKSDWQSDWWKDNSYTWESMLNQKTGKFSNFRYGGIYLSPSQENAAGYAKNNSYGSELLSSIIEALQDLESFDQNLALQLVPKGHWIRYVMTQKHQPILLTIKNMKISDLSTEKEQSTKELIEHMEDMLIKCPNMPTDLIWSQSNFHCKKPIAITSNNITHLN
jgi:hypothetical protein